MELKNLSKLYALGSRLLEEELCGTKEVNWIYFDQNGTVKNLSKLYALGSRLLEEELCGTKEVNRIYFDQNGTEELVKTLCTWIQALGGGALWDKRGKLDIF